MRTPPGYESIGDIAFVADKYVTNGKVVRGKKVKRGNKIPELEKVLP